MSDLIRREDAIEAFEEEMNGVNIQEAIKVVDAYLRIRECDAVWDAIRAIRDCLECAKDTIAEFVPSADRPRGEWEIYVISPFDGEDCRCSECGETGCAPYWNFCPSCGARMKGADDDR